MHQHVDVLDAAGHEGLGTSLAPPGGSIQNQKKYPNQKYELTEERERIIRELWDGRTATMRQIAEKIGVPWYTVRDWGQDRLRLPNPSSLQPNGPGDITLTPAPSPKPRFNGETLAGEQRASVEKKRAERAALLGETSADDAVRSDRAPLAQGWLTDKWAYSESFGDVLREQWDGSDAGLRQIATREQIPISVLRSWVTDHNIAPKRDDLAAWMSQADESAPVFVIASPAIVILRAGGSGYRILTPQGDWPNEIVTASIALRIVRMLSNANAYAAIGGTVFRAETPTT